MSLKRHDEAPGPSAASVAWQGGEKNEFQLGMSSDPDHPYILLARSHISSNLVAGEDDLSVSSHACWHV